jgi:hypothetical protein
MGEHEKKDGFGSWRGSRSCAVKSIKLAKCICTNAQQLPPAFEPVFYYLFGSNNRKVEGMDTRSKLGGNVFAS